MTIRNPIFPVIHSPALGPLTGRGGGGSALSLLDQMNQYAADGLFVSWLHLGDVTALWDAPASQSNIGHNGTLGLALGREQMGEYGTAYEYIQSLTVDIDTGDWSFNGWDISANDGSGGFDATKSTPGALDYSYSNDTVAGATGEVFFFSVDVDAMSVASFSTMLGAGISARSGIVANTMLGTVEGVLHANSAPNNYSIVVFSGNTGSLSVTGAALVEVPGNHWIQATAANRPLYNRISDGNGGFYTYLTYDGTNDSIAAPSSNSSVSLFLPIRTSAASGILFHDEPTSGNKHAGLWDGTTANIFPDASHVGTPTAHIFDPETETFSSALANRAALKAGCATGEWVVVEIRTLEKKGWNNLRINGRSGFLWAGDAGEPIEVLTSDRTDEMAVNIANFLLNQVGAA